MDLAYYDVLQLVAGGALILAGILAFALGRGNRKATTLGGFLIWISGLPIGQALRPDTPPLPTYLLVLQVAIILGVAFSFARFLKATMAGFKVPRMGIVLIAIATCLVATKHVASALLGPLPDSPFSPTQLYVLNGAGIIADAIIIAAGAIHPLIARHAEPEDTRRLGFISLGLAAVSMASLGLTISLFETGLYYGLAGVAITTPVVALPLLWFLPGPNRSVRRTIGIGILALNLIGGGLALIPNDGGAQAVAVLYAFGRMVAAGLLLTGVLMGAVPGIDRKIRFTISKTTLAAIFVAVFFIASEAAAAFFGDRAGNEYFGIAAAGLLVFAVSPIMRWTDRLAATAVPKQDAAAIFASAVRAALADGAISAKEEMHLAEVAEGLGLSPTQVASVRAQLA